MLASIRNHRLFIALLALAVHGAGVVVGGLGHSHEGPAHCCSVALCYPDSKGHAATKHDHHHGTCSHRHEHARPAQPTDQPDENRPFSGGPHDDCSLCRHFSQAVSPVTLIAELSASERVETLVPERLQQIVTAPRPSHPARGPPVASA